MVKDGALWCVLVHFFHELNPRGGGGDMGSSPVLEQKALCPGLNEQENRKGGLVYSALTRGALIYAFAMLGSGGVGPDY